MCLPKESKPMRPSSPQSQVDPAHLLWDSFSPSPGANGNPLKVRGPASQPRGPPFLISPHRPLTPTRDFHSHQPADLAPGALHFHYCAPGISQQNFFHRNVLLQDNWVFMTLILDSTAIILKVPWAHLASQELLCHFVFLER